MARPYIRPIFPEENAVELIDVPRFRPPKPWKADTAARRLDPFEIVLLPHPLLYQFELLPDIRPDQGQMLVPPLPVAKGNLFIQQGAADMHLLFCRQESVHQLPVCAGDPA